ncbi:hypothetical protein J2Z44_001706 [Clostridium punense]|uniref:Uncharacterized protein n=1 Tax=Clostridium punense TaxID=1054297 RepID=A0ABS4K291_9CLOT|nr:MULTISPECIES: hypothetical protein [Clostridium]EQB90148.1 hypothetical protein M918_01310 [Clostridium sp. BL8]MBP2021910.1 hypothetical protein [Clostridium punense]
MEKEKLIAELYKNVRTSDFLSQSYDILDKLNQYNDLDDTIEPLIKLIESNSDVDFGNPGPLVHYLEELNEEIYLVKLIESIRRNPTEHTLFMFNRTINSLNDYLKEECIGILQSVVESASIPLDLKNIANHYLSFQKGKNEVNETVEEVDIVLAKSLNNKSDLIKIKNILGLDISIRELFDCTGNLPVTLLKSIPIGRAKQKMNELGDISSKIQLVRVSDNQS